MPSTDPFIPRLTDDYPTTLREQLALPELINPNDLLTQDQMHDEILVASDGREWVLGKTVRNEWARVRKYSHTPRQCERQGGHEVRPTRWPVPAREIAQAVIGMMAPVKMQVEGIDWLRCERCR